MSANEMFSYTVYIKKTDILKAIDCLEAVVFMSVSLDDYVAVLTSRHDRTELTRNGIWFATKRPKGD